MKALFVGLGSIGIRHSKNLREICEKREIPLHITALRSYKGALNSNVFSHIDRMVTELDDTAYDIAFITNPTILHAETFKKVRKYAKFFFIEKPVFSDLSVSPNNIGMRDDCAYVAAPMRYCKVYQELKPLVKEYVVFNARIICSSYLPEWRPNQDYRKVYSSSKALGGGVSIDLIHEFDYAVDLFGFPQRCHTFAGQYSNLEMDADDVSVTIAEYPDLLCEIHLDYFGREYRRQCECFCAEGTLTADFGAGTIALPDGQIIHCEELVNERYLRELEAFLDFTLGKGSNNNPPSLAYNVLKIALMRD